MSGECDNCGHHTLECVCHDIEFQHQAEEYHREQVELRRLASLSSDLQAQLQAAQDALDAVTAERDALKQLVASLRRPKLDYSKDKPGGAA